MESFPPPVDQTADLPFNYFDSKVSMESVDMPLTCHPSTSLTTFSLGEYGKVFSWAFLVRL